ncbi:MAG: hypothetical protein NUV76_03705 [Candidatus Kuenenia sp.]|nr:hypothetical protein [Candidatus Kuenenia sp.]
MNPTTLQLWSVIGTWLAAIGTVGAVVTSLWLAFRQNKIKLKVSAEYIRQKVTGHDETRDCCFIKVVNAGPNPAKISYISWQVHRWFKKKYIQQDVNLLKSDTISKYLIKGDEANYFIYFNEKIGDYNWIASFLKNMVGEDSQKLIRSLKVIVHTSFGQSFTRKVEDSLIERLEESYEANKNIQTNAD